MQLGLSSVCYNYIFFLLNERFSCISPMQSAQKQQQENDRKKMNEQKKLKMVINMRETSDEHKNYNCIVSSGCARWVCH